MIFLTKFLKKQRGHKWLLWSLSLEKNHPSQAEQRVVLITSAAQGKEKLSAANITMRKY